MLSNNDDLYPKVDETSSSSAHLPQSPTLSGIIHLRPSESPTHEYECPSHTAEELRGVATRLSRMEVRGKGKKSVTIHDTVETEKLHRHLEQYRNTTNQTTSKL